VPNALGDKKVGYFLKMLKDGHFISQLSKVIYFLKDQVVTKPFSPAFWQYIDGIFI
jgi:hypothetical protein